MQITATFSASATVQRGELFKVAEAAGVEHPGLIGPGDVEILAGQSVATALHGVYGYDPARGYPSATTTWRSPT